jgi:hypothetical protein
VSKDAREIGQAGQPGQEGVGGGGRGGQGGQGGSGRSDHPMNLLGYTLVGCFVVVVAALLWSVHYSQSNTAQLKAEQINGCERANQQRRYINSLLLLHPELKLSPIVIPVCSDIIK